MQCIINSSLRIVKICEVTFNCARKRTEKEILVRATQSDYQKSGQCHSSLTFRGRSSFTLTRVWCSWGNPSVYISTGIVYLPVNPRTHQQNIYFPKHNIAYLDHDHDPQPHQSGKTCGGSWFHCRLQKKSPSSHWYTTAVVNTSPTTHHRDKLAFWTPNRLKQGTICLYSVTLL